MFKQYLFLSFLLLLTGTTLRAQKQTANWMLYPDSYHFSQSNPVISTQYRDTFSYSSSMSDKNGNLLFYTNGFDVWNNLGQKIEGSGYILNSLPFQCCGSRGIACVIVPSPSDTNQYYIFGSQPTGLIRSGNAASITSFAIVDMHLNNNKGKLISVQNIIDSSTSGVIAAVKHCNDKDFWIVTHKRYNTFLSVLLSSSGVSAPIESNSGVKKNFGTSRAIRIKFSPNGKYLGLASSYTPEIHYEILKFDNQTGIFGASLTDYISPQNPSVPNDGNIEFSSNSSKFYVVTNKLRLIQFDLTIPDSATVRNSADSMDIRSTYAGMLQLSLNKKIYVMASPANFTIDKPDLKTTDPSFTLSRVGGQSSHFPFFVASYFNQPYAVDSFCLNNPTVFKALDAWQYDSIRWDFGDQLIPLHTSTDSITHHTFSGYGNFTAKLKVYKCNSESVFEIPVSISSPSSIIFGHNDSLCVNTTPFKLNMASPDSGLYYLNNNLVDSLYPSALGPGTKFLVYKTMNDSGCWAVDSTPVTINPLPDPVISLSRSPKLCEGDSIVLTSNYIQNKWSNGSSTQSIVIKKTETISLTVTDSVVGCTNTSTPISVVSKSIPTTRIAPIDTLFCEGSHFVLSASGEGDFSWNNGYNGNKQTIEASQTKMYKVKVSNYCGSAEDSVHITVLRSNANVYPNPALTYLSVDLSECEGQGQTIEIFDEIGRTIRSFNTDQFSENIDLITFPDGLYFCRVGKKNLTVFKFVILR
jgi:hypothetical protein